MWFDVVDVSRQSDDSLLLAFNAKRMRFKDPCAKALPSVTVASGCRTACALGSVRFSFGFHLSVTSVALFKMQVTVFLPKRYRLATAGILAYR